MVAPRDHSPEEIRFAAVVPAAGTGSRMGGRKKPYITLCGRPILHHAIERLLEASCCEQLVVVVHRDEFAEGRVAAELEERFGPIQVVCGGPTRQASVLEGLRAVGDGEELVLIHDAVRPLVSPEVVHRVAVATSRHGAAIAAVPATETVKRVTDGDTIAETPLRGHLWYARTPQGFRKDLILRAHSEHAGGPKATDDAELVERLGHSVHVVRDRYDNVKITTEEDLIVAEAILRWRRSSGTGGQD